MGFAFGLGCEENCCEEERECASCETIKATLPDTLIVTAPNWDNSIEIHRDGDIWKGCDDRVTEDPSMLIGDDCEPCSAGCHATICMGIEAKCGSGLSLLVRSTVLGFSLPGHCEGDTPIHQCESFGTRWGTFGPIPITSCDPFIATDGHWVITEP